MNEQTIQALLAEVLIPHMQQDLVHAKAIKNIQVQNKTCQIDLELPFPAQGIHDVLTQSIQDKLASLDLEQVDISISHNIVGHAVQTGVTTLPNVKNTIAVASGKGGVGKSTTSINIALALQAEGAKVGILDADIYGPSQPRMLGNSGMPDSVDGKTMKPKVSYGIQSMSIGYMIEEDTAMIWRGPMATGALEQLINDTQWEDLDYLIIDLPPGTGDIQLTLSQRIPLSGALIVTTPQDIALIDAKKALGMFNKVKVPVLGIVENMSIHICSQCGHQEPIFGSGGGDKMAKQYEVDLLGQLPLDMSIREGVDNGRPTVAMDTESEISQIYRTIAREMAAKLSIRTRDYTNVFPKIVVENN